MSLTNNQERYFKRKIMSTLNSEQHQQTNQHLLANSSNNDLI